MVRKKVFYLIVILCAALMALGGYFSLRLSDTENLTPNAMIIRGPKSQRVVHFRKLTDDELNEFVKDRKNGFKRAFAAQHGH